MPQVAEGKEEWKAVRQCWASSRLLPHPGRDLPLLYKSSWKRAKPWAHRAFGYQGLMSSVLRQGGAYCHTVCIRGTTSRWSLLQDSGQPGELTFSNTRIYTLPGLLEWASQEEAWNSSL